MNRNSIYVFLNELSNRNDARLIRKAFARFFPEATESTLDSVPNLAAVTASADEMNRTCDLTGRVVNLTAATLSLTVAAHEGRTVTVNRAAGSTLTLPASSGSGARFRVVVGTALTSGSLILQVANATDVMQGFMDTMSDDPATVKSFQAAATSDTITLNRTTTGVASKGEWIEVEDVASGFWQVRGMTSSTGTEATPFSAAV